MSPEEQRAAIVQDACDLAQAWQREYRERLAGPSLRLLLAMRMYERRGEPAEHFLYRVAQLVRDALPAGVQELALALYNAGWWRGNRSGRPPGARQRPLLTSEQADVNDLAGLLASQMPRIEEALR